MTRRSTIVIGTSCLAFAAMAVAGTVKINPNPNPAKPAAPIVVVTVPAATPTPSPTPTPKPTPSATPTASSTTTATATVTTLLKPLAPLYLADMKLWNWNGTWTASEWSNANSPIPWKYDHIAQVKGETSFTLDSVGAPELQAMNATPAYTRGLWETDVTLPSLRDGMIVAPLWIYDTTSKDEVDFEYAGRKGMDVSLHATSNGKLTSQTVRLFAGRDMSGERHRFGIKVDESIGVVEMYLDGVRVYRWDKTDLAYTVTHPLKPWIEMWAANPTNAGFVAWAGKWAGMTAKDKPLVMTVHGYGYSTIP